MGGSQIHDLRPEESSSYEHEKAKIKTNDIYNRSRDGLEIISLGKRGDRKPTSEDQTQNWTIGADSLVNSDILTQQDRTNAVKHTSVETNNFTGSHTNIIRNSAQYTGSNLNANCGRFSTSDQHEHPDQLDQLSLVFPNIPLKHLRAISKRAQGNLEEAMELCLSYDFLKDHLNEDALAPKWTELEKGASQYISKKINTKKNLKSDNSFVDDSDTNALKSHFEKIDEVIELLGLQNTHGDLVGCFLKKNNYDVAYTVLDILVNWKPHESFENQGLREPTECFIKNLTSSSYAETVKQDSNEVVLDFLPATCNDSQLHSVWPELALNIRTNPKLQLPFTFYVNSLLWFNYELPKVLTLAYRLSTEFNMKSVKVSCRKENIEKEILKNIKIGSPSSEQSKGTYAEVVKPIKLHNNAWNQENHLRSKIKNKAFQLSSEKNSHVKAVYSTQLTTLNGELNNLHQKEQRKMVDLMRTKAANCDTIDLHGLSVKYALQLVDETLADWWENEISMRIERGGKVNSKKALHVDPFTIVTGRGVHSAGNIPKIKNSVRSKLAADSWIFDEHSSGFLVSGNRNR